jgi:hypothetical protein
LIGFVFFVFVVAKGMEEVFDIAGTEDGGEDGHDGEDGEGEDDGVDRREVRAAEGFDDFGRHEREWGYDCARGELLVYGWSLVGERFYDGKSRGVSLGSRSKKRVPVATLLWPWSPVKKMIKVGRGVS